MIPSRPQLFPHAGSIALTAALLWGAAACGGSEAGASGAAGSSGAGAGTGTVAVAVGAHSNGAAAPVTLDVPTGAAIRAELPKSIVDSGKLVIGLGLLPEGAPPRGFVGDDQKTLTGSEPDLGRLVAAVFGLTPDLQNATWDNLFIGVDSGRTNIGFSNVTDTELRKQKYDFASYRQDNLGFEVLKKNDWNFAGNYENLAGKTAAVSAGTNQEKILIEWQTKLKAEGKKLSIKYFPDESSAYLALYAGNIDAYFTPNPSIAYHVRQTANTPNPTRDAGAFSGAGASLQGLICTLSKKGSGLAKPAADAINYLIKNGQYAKWLAAWNLSTEAVPTSQVNPPGLPLSNS